MPRAVPEIRTVYATRYVMPLREGGSVPAIAGVVPFSLPRRRGKLNHSKQGASEPMQSRYWQWHLFLHEMSLPQDATQAW